MPETKTIPLADVEGELLERIVNEVNTSYIFCDPPPPREQVEEIVKRALKRAPRSLSPAIPVNPHNGAAYILPIVSELSGYVMAVITGADEEELAEDPPAEESLPEYDPEQMAELEKGAAQAQEDAE